jgi:hypothetical protein
MVIAQHRLLTEQFGIALRLVPPPMGGMLTWMLGRCS